MKCLISLIIGVARVIIEWVALISLVRYLMNQNK